MKLRKLRARNFKLLADIEIEFSTDPDRPLTVVRAENGSGKTSMLYALLWGFYGLKGLPDAAGEVGLSPTFWEPGRVCEVSVTIEFESTSEEPFAGESVPRTTRYVLNRSATEVRRQGKTVTRQREDLVIHAHSDEGAEKLEDAAARALIRRLAPDQLRNIFFTDGDAVQRFITGDLGPRARQSAVHDAIKALLGLDSLRTAETDLAKAQKTFKKRLSDSPGADALKDIFEELEQATDSEQELEDDLKKLRERINNVTEAVERRESRLYELKGLGDIERIGKQRDSAKEILKSAEPQLEELKRRQRALMKSEKLSWALISDTLVRGCAALEDLAGQGVIPGASVEVLRDRLNLGRCICGESLEKGTTHREEVEKLIREQASVGLERQRLTALLHQARPLKIAWEESQANSESWLDQLSAIERNRAVLEKQIRNQTETLKECEDSLRRLEEAEVDRLLDELNRDRAQQKAFIADERELKINLDRLKARLCDLDERYREAQGQVQNNTALQNKINVTDDLLRLVRQTLETLEGEYLEKASNRMNSLFMEIAGSTPEVGRAVFTEVRLTGNYEIEVLSGGHGRTLDPDFEINGASKRALTLSFIWALMEVAEIPAPRIIDTPLGMTSGGVKRRFVDLLTEPSGNELQVVLLMTRSEISHVEDLLDDRAGVIRTLSCSKDYPVDLLHDWGGQNPVVAVCACTHRESCDICARRDDGSYQLSQRLTSHTSLGEIQ